MIRKSAMSRFALSALMILTSAPALAAGDAAKNCATTASIVAEAVKQRVSGSAPANTYSAIAGGDLEAQFVPAVQPLVDWVYTLPADQLTGEAAAAFEAACLEQAG